MNTHSPIQTDIHSFQEHSITKEKKTKICSYDLHLFTLVSHKAWSTVLPTAGAGDYWAWEYNLLSTCTTTKGDLAILIICFSYLIYSYQAVVRNFAARTKLVRTVKYRVQESFELTSRLARKIRTLLQAVAYAYTYTSNNNFHENLPSIILIEFRHCYQKPIGIRTSFEQFYEPKQNIVDYINILMLHLAAGLKYYSNPKIFHEPSVSEIECIQEEIRKNEQLLICQEVDEAGQECNFPFWSAEQTDNSKVQHRNCASFLQIYLHPVKFVASNWILKRKCDFEFSKILPHVLSSSSPKIILQEIFNKIQRYGYLSNLEISTKVRVYKQKYHPPSCTTITQPEVAQRLRETGKQAIIFIPQNAGLDMLPCLLQSYVIVGKSLCQYASELQREWLNLYLKYYNQLMGQNVTKLLNNFYKLQVQCTQDLYTYTSDCVRDTNTNSLLVQRQFKNISSHRSTKVEILPTDIIRKSGTPPFRDVIFLGRFKLHHKAPSEASFRGTEYLTIDLSKADPILSTQESISLQFKTRQPNGLLFYSVAKSHFSFIRIPVIPLQEDCTIVKV
ncbi:hypothetical protein WN51_10908 [Melipona quadrifasciata]|uniref:Uncharacterized protein n=1 Tax=Melipona quadrifasciata TaxID=166423 RepID=A0A0N0U680_9HYME|nr:hypothetical protein WN51_10908 [Melipona quadrifasciata]